MRTIELNLCSARFRFTRLYRVPSLCYQRLIIEVKRYIDPESQSEKRQALSTLIASDHMIIGQLETYHTNITIVCPHPHNICDTLSCD